MNGLCCFHQGASLNIQIHQKSHAFSVPIELFTSSTLIPSRFTCCLHNKIRLKPTAFQNASSLVHGLFLSYFQNRYRRMSRASIRFHVKTECPHSFNTWALTKTLSGRQMANLANSAQPLNHQAFTWRKWLANWQTDPTSFVLAALVSDSLSSGSLFACVLLALSCSAGPFRSISWKEHTEECTINK